MMARLYLLTGVLGIHGTEEPRQRVSGGAGHLPAE